MPWWGVGEHEKSSPVYLARWIRLYGVISIQDPLSYPMMDMSDDEASWTVDVIDSVGTFLWLHGTTTTDGRVLWLTA